MWPPPSIFLELCLQERTTSRGLYRSSVLAQTPADGEPRAQDQGVCAPCFFRGCEAIKYPPMALGPCGTGGRGTEVGVLLVMVLPIF
ncbi:hypothetical protein LEMLEM_LOCUS22070 [Lemmus lemmus]